MLTDVCHDDHWTAPDAELLDEWGIDLRGDGGSPRTLALLTWLRHIEGNLTKSGRFGAHRYWLRRNVDRVLAAATAPATVRAR